MGISERKSRLRANNSIVPQSAVPYRRKAPRVMRGAFIRYGVVKTAWVRYTVFRRTKERQAVAMNPIIENIVTRRSIRSYLDKPIAPEILGEILRAASYAPSAMGMQTRRMTAIQGREGIKKVNDAIREALRSIPITEKTNPYIISLIEKAQSPDSEFLYGAPAYVIITDEESNLSAMADSTLAAGCLMLAAHAYGIGSCWLNQVPGMTQLPPIKALLRELGLPEEHRAYSSIVLGYAAGELPEAAERKDRVTIIG